MTNINIGIVVDFKLQDNENGDSYPYYLLNDSLVSVFSGIANVFLLPYERFSTANYIELVDGLVLANSSYPVDPFYYGESKKVEYSTDNRRSDFEFDMLRRAFDKNIPVLGIGGGMQIINVFFGGSMYQNISEEIPGVINHYQTTKGMDAHQKYHENVILPNTELARAVGTEILQVNSLHVQAIKKLGEGLKINSISKVDNIIEGIESDRPEKWVMGVQWHPNYIYFRENIEDEREKRIFDAFVAKAEENKKER